MREAHVSTVLRIKSATNDDDYMTVDVAAYLRWQLEHVKDVRPDLKWCDCLEVLKRCHKNDVEMGALTDVADILFPPNKDR
jgi:hypothetical protein